MPIVSVVPKFSCGKCDLYFYGDGINICPFCGHPVKFLCKADVNYLKQFMNEVDLAVILIRQPKGAQQTSLLEGRDSMRFRVSTP